MMDAGKLFGRGISFPPRIGPDGRLAWSEGEANIRESIAIILQTEPRERIYRADFGGGLGQLLFDPNNAATHARIRERILLALARWEPRITVEEVRVEHDPADSQAAIATIEYRLVATQARDRVSMAVVLSS